MSTDDPTEASEPTQATETPEAATPTMADTTDGDGQPGSVPEGATTTSSEGPGDEHGLPDEQTLQMIQQLRAAPAEQLLAEVFSTLLSTAQIKLGRRDARLFIDLCAQTLDYTRPYLATELTRQIDDALNQLRLGQVSAEPEVAAGDPEPNDLTQTPTPRPASAPSPAAPPASKLWVPGQ